MKQFDKNINFGKQFSNLLFHFFLTPTNFCLICPASSVFIAEIIRLENFWLCAILHIGSQVSNDNEQERENELIIFYITALDWVGVYSRQVD